jgi:hypothetical protein
MFVQHFFLKPLDFSAPMWYYILVPRGSGKTAKKKNLKKVKKTLDKPPHL